MATKLDSFIKDFIAGRPVVNPEIAFINRRGKLQRGTLVYVTESLRNLINPRTEYNMLHLMIETTSPSKKGGTTKTREKLTIEYYCKPGEPLPPWGELYYPNYQTA